MAGHFAWIAALWLVLTVVGEALALTFGLNPLGYAREAALVDDAFRLLTVLAVPVFALVVAALGYSLVRFRSRGEPPEDGPPIRDSVPVTSVWLAVTTGLCIYVIFNPGIIGLNAIRDGGQESDLLVRVEGRQWTWRFSYPAYNITSSQLVLPVDKRVRFEVTSTDIIHSFWVPGFRMKIDAVPGMVTTVSVTPNRRGAFDEDSVLRVQCAELCGTLHGNMVSPVSVVVQREFEEWVAQQRARR